MSNILNTRTISEFLKTQRRNENSCKIHELFIDFPLIFLKSLYGTKKLYIVGYLGSVW